jgi:hypothetical protein
MAGITASRHKPHMLLRAGMGVEIHLLSFASTYFEIHYIDF